MSDDTAWARRRRGQRGAASQRLVLALAASALLTAAVALPMAYQAHEARQANEPPPKDDTEVMGTTTIKEPEARIDALVWRSAPNGTAEVLHGATVTSAPRVQLDDEAVRRADFRVDDGPVQTDTTAPFQVNDGAPVELAPGAHSVTATVTYDDGRSALHQAFFTVTG